MDFNYTHISPLFHTKDGESIGAEFQFIGDPQRAPTITLELVKNLTEHFKLIVLKNIKTEGDTALKKYLSGMRPGTVDFFHLDATDENTKRITVIAKPPSIQRLEPIKISTVAAVQNAIVSLTPTNIKLQEFMQESPPFYLNNPKKNDLNQSPNTFYKVWDKIPTKQKTEVNFTGADDIRVIFSTSPVADGIIHGRGCKKTFDNTQNPLSLYDIDIRN